MLSQEFQLFASKVWFSSEANSTILINKAFSYIYTSGFWLRSSRGKRLADSFAYFLSSYQRLAYLTFVDGKNRYQFQPKLHYMHHFVVELDRQCGLSDWVENPLGTSVQVQEDYVGRPSRASRRVSIRRIHRNVVFRLLILQCRALIQADHDERGMNSYSVA